MNDRPFIIGSGYYNGRDSGADWFYNIWENNTIEALDRLSRLGTGIVVVSVGNSIVGSGMSRVHHIRLSGNLGHVGQLLSGEKLHHLCGWSAAVLTLAMIAYTNESDFIYKEQDCLAFGPWIEKLYEEIGDAGLIFGKSNLMPCAQSLFLVKHAYIPCFVKRYLATPAENKEPWLPEKKFWRMMRESPDKVKQFSFGYDRDRPFNLTDLIWYGQKLTQDELRALATAGLIDIAGMPDVKIFSNT